MAELVLQRAVPLLLLSQKIFRPSFAIPQIYLIHYQGQVVSAVWEKVK
jgi:hypothetical protein